MNTRYLHRLFGSIVGIFIVFHLANHVAGFWGQAMHRSVQDAFRLVYRSQLVETILLFSVVIQIGLGATLQLRQKRLTLQSLSGLYLAGFLLIHVGAVLAARHNGTNTDLAFAAAGLHAGLPWPVFLGLYYGFAVVAVFIHVSVPIRRFAGTRWSKATILSGLFLAIALVLLLAGWLTPLKIPNELISTFP